MANPSKLTLTQSGGTVNNTTIYVRFKPAAVQTYSGNITHTSTGATQKDVAVSGTGTAAANDMTMVSANGESATISSLINDASIENTSQGAQAWQMTFDNPSGGAGAGTITAITFTQGAGNGVSDWSTTIQAAELFVGTDTSGLKAGTVSGSSIAFSGLSVAVAEGSPKTLSLRISLKSTAGALTDNTKFQFKLTSANVTVSGNGVTTAEINSDQTKNQIAVVATKLAFTANDTAVGVNQNFSATVKAEDANSNVDLDSTASVTISKASGSGTLSAAGGLTKSLSSGSYTWSDLQYNAAGTFTIQAAGGSLTAATSDNIVASQFTAGNLAVFRADASVNNTTVTILEILPSTASQSTPVSSTAISGTGADAIRVYGSSTSVGYLTRSDDRTLLSFTGHNNTTTSVAADTLNPRAACTLNVSRNFVKQTTYTGSSGNQTRSATTVNNSTWFIGDQSGFYSNGSSSASPAGNIRSVKSFGGTVYAFRASASYPSVSTISAATGGTLTGLPGLQNGATTRQDFYLVCSGDNGFAYDVLYIIDSTGAIYKHSLVSGTWTANGSYSTGVGGFGLCAADNGNGALLYITTGTGATSANKAQRLTDSTGYNTTINISATMDLYTAPSGTTMKGIDFAPNATATYYSQGSGAPNTLASWNTVRNGGGGVTPANFTGGDSFIIQNGRTMTMNATWSVTGAIEVQSGGALLCGNYLLDGAANFTLSSGATLGIGSADGITASAASGNIQVTGARAFDTGANYTYNGSGAQVTGNGLPATVNNLTIDNTAGVTLSQAVAANGTLGGIGKIIGAITVNNNATVAPGNSIDTLTVDNLSFAGDSTYLCEITDPLCDKVVVTDTLTLPSGAGVMTIEIPSSATLVQNTDYDVITYGSIVGYSAGKIDVINPPSFVNTINVIVGSEKLTLHTTPEPGVCMLAGLALLALRKKLKR